MKNNLDPKVAMTIICQGKRSVEEVAEQAETGDNIQRTRHAYAKLFELINNCIPAHLGLTKELSDTFQSK